jgi:anaerobic ribonucleoside-triphosphate reductase
MASKNKVSISKKETKKVLGKKEDVVEKKLNKNIFIKSVLKRDGVLVPFEFDKIMNAINKAMLASGEGSTEDAKMVANRVLDEIVKIAKKYKNFLPTVEGVQDTVEQELMLSDFVKTSKNYILYREERARLRAHSLSVPAHLKKLNEESKKYLEIHFLNLFIIVLMQSG